MALSSSEAMSSDEVDTLPVMLNIRCPAATAEVMGLVVGYRMKFGVFILRLNVPGSEEGRSPR